MIDFSTDFTSEPTREIPRETMSNVVNPQAPQLEDIERERAEWIAEWEGTEITVVNPFPSDPTHPGGPLYDQLASELSKRDE